jgi:hypothetical protein
MPISGGAIRPAILPGAVVRHIGSGGPDGSWQTEAPVSFPSLDTTEAATGAGGGSQGRSRSQ